MRRVETEPENVFQTDVIRPRDLDGKTSIKVSPKTKVVLDGVEEISHLEIKSGKVAQLVNVLGPFPDHLTIDGRFNQLKLGGSLELVNWGGFRGDWSSGLVCNHIQPVTKRPDITAMIFPQSTDDVLTFGPEHCGKTLAIRGPSTISRIVIEPEVQMEHIMIQSMPWLEEIVLKGRVTQMEISNCPLLKNISGHGLYLSAHTNSYQKTGPLNLRGFWQNLDVTHNDCDLSSFILSEDDVKDAEDLSGRIIVSDDYLMQCKWAEDFDVDIEEAALGLSFQQLGDLWVKNERKARSVFLDWLGDDRYIIDRRYFGMRIAMSLLLNGHKMKAVRARNLALTGKAGQQLVPQKLRPLISSNFHRDMEVFAPYDILDTEFLARSMRDNKMPPVLGDFSDSVEGQYSILNWLILLQENRKDDFGPMILDICNELVTHLRSGRISNIHSFNSHSTIISIILCLENMETVDFQDNIVMKLADVIMELPHEAMHKAALIIALMQIEDKPALRKYLGKLTPLLDRGMNSVVHPFRIRGVKAFERLTIEHLPHPYNPYHLQRGITI